MRCLRRSMHSCGCLSSSSGTNSSRLGRLQVRLQLRWHPHTQLLTLSTPLASSVCLSDMYCWVPSCSALTRVRQGPAETLLSIVNHQTCHLFHDLGSWARSKHCRADRSVQAVPRRTSGSPALQPRSNKGHAAWCCSMCSTRLRPLQRWTGERRLLWCLQGAR